MEIADIVYDTLFLACGFQSRSILCVILMNIFGELGFKAGGIFFAFGPFLLLSLAVTIDRKNWKILYQHPYIILLPVFTYFTFSKNKILCGGATDSRLVFSKNFTYFNMLLTGGAFIWVFMRDASFNSGFFVIMLVPLVLSVVPTILFMKMPRYSDDCEDCGCCNIHNDVHLYDADTGLVIRKDDEDGNKEDDVEVALNSSSIVNQLLI